MMTNPVQNSIINFSKKKRKIVILGNLKCSVVHNLAVHLSASSWGVEIFSVDKAPALTYPSNVEITSIAETKTPKMLRLLRLIWMINTYIWCNHRGIIHIVDDGKYGALSRFILSPRKLISMDMKVWARASFAYRQRMKHAFKRSRGVTTNGARHLEELHNYTRSPVFLAKMPGNPNGNDECDIRDDKKYMRKILQIYSVMCSGKNLNYLIDDSAEYYNAKPFNIFYSTAKTTRLQREVEIIDRGLIAKRLATNGLLLRIDGSAQRKREQWAKARYWHALGANIRHAIVEVPAEKNLSTHTYVTGRLPDRGFMQWLRNNGIKVALFQDYATPFTPQLQAKLGFKKYFATKILSTLTARVLRRNADIIFTQSGGEHPAKAVHTSPRVVKLDGIADPRTKHRSTAQNNRLRLLYLGGFDQTYELRKLCAAVSILSPLVQLTVIDHNNQASDLIENLRRKFSNTTAIQLQPFCPDWIDANASEFDVGALLSRRGEHWQAGYTNALYDYISLSIPLITTENTPVGDLVTKYNLGWTTAYTVEGIVQLLTQLISKRQSIQDKTPSVLEFAWHNSVAHRTKQIEQVLQVA